MTQPEQPPEKPSELAAELSRLLDLLGPDQRPNLNALTMKLRDLNNLALTVKFFGYDLARRLAADLPPPQRAAPHAVNLRSKASTQADLESDWAACWCAELKAPRIFHRKVWELAFVLQALWEHGLVGDGRRGLGFGCGHEPIPSYLAAKGVHVTVTDMAPDEAKARGWLNSGQHATTLDTLFMPHLVDRAAFDRNVRLQYVDMNVIPSDLTGYDFCWSICALEHLGSIAAGLAFIRNSLSTLRPGGLAVHTTEFNFLDDNQTIDNWPTVLFQRRHFTQLADDLRRDGHEIGELDFHIGDKPLDKFIDVPPFAHDWPLPMASAWGDSPAHLKISIDGFAATCFGLIIRKGR
jgi:2-polyprenyl-3-methyl-5-hydroxy-6-metoxy-1,4-benzoquinol methylase